MKEITNLYVKTYKFKNLTVDKVSEKLAGVKAELIDLSVEFEPKDLMKLTIRGLEVVSDRKNEVFTFGSSKLAAPVIEGKV